MLFANHIDPAPVEDQNLPFQILFYWQEFQMFQMQVWSWQLQCPAPYLLRHFAISTFRQLKILRRVLLRLFLSRTLLFPFHNLPAIHPLSWKQFSDYDLSNQWRLNPIDKPLLKIYLNAAGYVRDLFQNNSKDETQADPYSLHLPFHLWHIPMHTFLLFHRGHACT